MLHNEIEKSQNINFFYIFTIMNTSFFILRHEGSIPHEQAYNWSIPFTFRGVWRNGNKANWEIWALGTFRSVTNPELRVTSSDSALAAFVSGRFVSCLRASAGFLVGKYERRKYFLNASKVSSSYFSCISYPLYMSGIPWHCSRRDRNDFHVNLVVMKKSKTSTMLIPWHYDDSVIDDVTLRQRHVIHCLNHC
jgi:hypothetical protein